MGSRQLFIRFFLSFCLLEVQERGRFCQQFFFVGRVEVLLLGGTVATPRADPMKLATVAGGWTWMLLRFLSCN